MFADLIVFQNTSIEVVLKACKHIADRRWIRRLDHYTIVGNEVYLSKLLLLKAFLRDGTDVA